VFKRDRVPLKKSFPLPLLKGKGDIRGIGLYKIGVREINNFY
jgi:hypothetical protein